MDFEILDPRQPRCGDVWVNPHNNMESSSSDGNAVLRHYICDTLSNAVGKWGKIKDVSAAARAVEIVEALAQLRDTTVFETFHLDTTGYLAVVFADDLQKGAAFINPGHVDHYMDAEWAVALEKKPGIWRSYLPTSRSGGITSGRTKVTETTCECQPGLLISIHAPCDRCGLRAVDKIVDYD